MESLVHENTTVVGQDQERGKAVVKLKMWNKNQADKKLTQQGARFRNKAQDKRNWPPKNSSPDLR